MVTTAWRSSYSRSTRCALPGVLQAARWFPGVGSRPALRLSFHPSSTRGLPNAIPAPARVQCSSLTALQSSEVTFWAFSWSSQRSGAPAWRVRSPSLQNLVLITAETVCGFRVRLNQRYQHSANLHHCLRQAPPPPTAHAWVLTRSRNRPHYFNNCANSASPLTASYCAPGLHAVPCANAAGRTQYSRTVPCRQRYLRRLATDRALAGTTLDPPTTDRPASQWTGPLNCNRETGQSQCASPRNLPAEGQLRRQPLRPRRSPARGNRR